MAANVYACDRGRGQVARISPTGEMTVLSTGTANAPMHTPNAAATMSAHLHDKQAAIARRLVQSGRRVIGMAVRNPYDLLAFPELRT